jgi:hypothetical protein
MAAINIALKFRLMSNMYIFLIHFIYFSAGLKTCLKGGAVGLALTSAYCAYTSDRIQNLFKWMALILNRYW